MVINTVWQWLGTAQKPVLKLAPLENKARENLQRITEVLENSSLPVSKEKVLALISLLNSDTDFWSKYFSRFDFVDGDIYIRVSENDMYNTDFNGYPQNGTTSEYDIQNLKMKDFVWLYKHRSREYEVYVSWINNFTSFIHNKSWWLIQVYDVESDFAKRKNHPNNH